MSGGLGGASLRQRSAEAAADHHLGAALRNVTNRLAVLREDAQASLDNFDALRTAARAVRADVIARLPEVLERLADNVEANGGTVFWAGDGDEANRYIGDVARRTGARTVVKGKSMATEETGLNAHLASLGVEVVETDLGEWILQVAHDTPSHIIAPAIHLTRGDVSRVLNRLVTDGRAALSDVPEELCAFARDQLRQRFLDADLGITGCNFGVAETGSLVLVSNEGNGRMSTSFPRVHIAVMGMERVVETWEQLDVMMALLPRAATGQDISVYVNALSGPRRTGEVDGPDELHLVILDNGRSDLIGGEYEEMLNCIRCGACLNVCPVYRQIGGHAYGWVYSGPMGAVLTPLLNREPNATELSAASTLCGACFHACPVQIPLQDLLLSLRRAKAANAGRASRAAWRAWSETWSRPGLYRASTGLAGAAGRVLPEALAPHGWTDTRALPRPPSGQTGRNSFRSRFRRGEI